MFVIESSTNFSLKSRETSKHSKAGHRMMQHQKEILFNNPRSGAPSLKTSHILDVASRHKELSNMASSLDCFTEGTISMILDHVLKSGTNPTILYLADMEFLKRCEARKVFPISSSSR